MRWPRQLFLLLALLGLVYATRAAMDGRWFAMAGFTVCTTYWAFRATHPQRWLDARVKRMVDRLEKRR